MGSYIFLNILLQIAYTIGAVFLLGYIIALLNKVFYSLVNHRRAVVYATGIIGTPIHELSHALMCIVFGHHIDEIKLFQMDDENGVLGYVRHSYNPKNFWSRTGNYFIGVAPIICGAAVLFFIMKLTLPYTADVINGYLQSFSALLAKGPSFEWFNYLFTVFNGFIKSVFTESLSSSYWWIFWIFAVCIALHMNLSSADIKGALPAVPIVCILIAVINLALGFILPSVYNGYLNLINMTCAYLIGVMLLALIISICYVLIGFLIKLIISLIGKIFGR